MQVVDIIIYVLMFYYGLQGYTQGGVGRKFYFEKNFLSISLAPLLMPIIRPLIEQYTNFVLGFILAWALSYIVMISIVIFIYSRSVQIIRTPHDKVDKWFGGLLGFIKGFLMAGLITFVAGVVYADKFLPIDVANKLKYSHAGLSFSKPINFYRFFIFGVSKVEIDTQIAYEPGSFYEELNKEYNNKHKW
jgi:uncharacterized membrane protein required for colicin V production